jgi:hypothetical protein
MTSIAKLSDSIFKQPWLSNRHCEPTGRANARPMTGSAKQSIVPHKERMDCFAALAMTLIHMRPHSRGAIRPSCARNLPPQTKGVGNAGRTVHPQSRVQGWKVERTRVVTVAPESPGIPARNGFTAYTVLPGDRALLPPSPALLGANLTPASGRQDHTVLPYATRPRLSLWRAWYPSAKTPAKAETAPFVAHAVSPKAITSHA